MRVLILESGTLEYFWGLSSQLVYLGIEVYILNLELWNTVEEAEKETFDPDSFDFVIVANLFQEDHILKTLASLSIKCPIFLLCLTHPVRETERFWQRYGQKRLNEFLKQRKIKLWIPCFYAAQEYHLLGFQEGIFAPFGSFNLVPVPEFRFKWLKRGKHQLLDRLRMVEEMRGTAETTYGQVETTQLVYLGRLAPGASNPPPQIMKTVDPLAKEAARQCVADPAHARSEQSDVRKHLCSWQTTEGLQHFLLFDQQFYYHHCQQTRLAFVRQLAGTYRAHFLLCGDDWASVHIPARPSQNRVRSFLYYSIPLSPDFGSLSFETCYFPRSIEIVNSGGCLLSYTRPDTSKYFGPLSKELTFTTPKELIEKGHRLLADPSLRDRVKAQLKQYWLEKHSISESVAFLLKNA